MSDHEHPPQDDPFASRESLHAAFGVSSSELRCVDFCPICRAADVLRVTASPEIRDQWQSVQREALVTMKALVDHYLERIDAEAESERRPAVQDIPID